MAATYEITVTPTHIEKPGRPKKSKWWSLMPPMPEYIDGFRATIRDLNDAPELDYRGEVVAPTADAALAAAKSFIDARERREAHRKAATRKFTYKPEVNR